jgi:hypothetical protein
MYVSAVIESFRCPTKRATSAHERPCRCKSEIRRCLRSCGENTGTPFGLARLRDRGAEGVGAGVGEKPRLRVAEAAVRQRRLDRLGEHVREVDP